MPDELPNTPIPPENQPGHHPEVEQDKPRLPATKHPRKATESVRRTFGFAFDDLYRWADRPLGIGPDSASVEVDADKVVARFGRWTAEIDRADIVAAEVTGPYRILKTIGPPHLSFADRGITFATNRRRGVCIRLARPIKAMEPIGLLRHPSITLTVEDPEGLAELLA